MMTQSRKRRSSDAGETGERQGDFTAWERPAVARPTITRDQVIRQALALLDEVGFDGLTMRRLAERLGVRAAALYNHVRNKQELLALLADVICGEAPEIDPTLPWREAFEAFAWDYRRVLLAHRDAARVLAATLPTGPQRLRLVEQGLAAARATGLSDEDAADAAWIFNTYVTGYVLDEAPNAPPSGASDDPASAASEQLKQWMRSLPADRYPTIVAFADSLFDSSSDRRFAFGLKTLFDGLEQRIAAR